MAVTKIRKTSSTVLLVIAILALAVIIAFFAGGYVDPTVAKPEPTFTDLLLYFCYGVFLLSVLVLIGFAIFGFINSLRSNAKSALGGLAAIVGLAVLLGVSYALGSTEHLQLSSGNQVYNTDHYLKFSDMWVYSTYVMLAVTILALIWSGVRGVFTKKK